MWILLVLTLLAIILIIAAITTISSNIWNTWPTEVKDLVANNYSVYQEFLETSTFIPPDDKQYYAFLRGYGNGGEYGPVLIPQGSTVEFNLNSPVNYAQSAVKVGEEWNIVEDGVDPNDTTPAIGYILTKNS